MKTPTVSRLAEKLVAGGEKSDERNRKYEIISGVHVQAMLCHIDNAFCPLARDLS